MLQLRHSGKLGDIIYSLPTVLRLGGGNYLLDTSLRFFNKPALGKRAGDAIIPILEAQPYIQSVDNY